MRISLTKHKSTPNNDTLWKKRQSTQEFKLSLRRQPHFFLRHNNIKIALIIHTIYISITLAQYIGFFMLVAVELTEFLSPQKMLRK